MSENCPACGEQLSVFRRSDSKFCSVKCKQKAYRQRVEEKAKAAAVTARGAAKRNVTHSRRKRKAVKA